MRILVTRPSPGAEATAARLRDLGHQPILLPLLLTEPIAYSLPPEPPQAVMLTSAAAARLAGATAAPLLKLPAFAVGAATATAARAAGFTDVRYSALVAEPAGSALRSAIPPPASAIPPQSPVQTLIHTIATAGFTRLLHLAGIDRTPFVAPPGLTVTVAQVYRARLQPLDDLPTADWTLLLSVRTAAHFASECDRLAHPRHHIGIAALSPAVAAAAGKGWCAVVIARSPDETALLAAIGATWQDPS